LLLLQVSLDVGATEPAVSAQPPPTPVRSQGAHGT
jgi:hypothetical protein